ncbi:MAG: extracellular solute-binding protein [Parcubacteria group bacterium]|jgi:multiple sugar transport system substrate-binding protein
MRKKVPVIFSLLLICSLVVLSGCGCKSTSKNTYQTKLEIWGLFDDSDVMTKAIGEFRKRNPRIRDISYKKMTVETYEQDLLDALATGKGPDIFLIHNTWLTKHEDKLAPAPQILDSSNQPQPIVNPKQVSDAFSDVVSQDFVRDSQIYALPQSVDSLALYYNKDLFNQAGLTAPPKTWTEFDETVKKLTKIDSFGNITLAGAAMGASSDASVGTGKINRATDILTLIMMQAGADMFDSQSNMARFADSGQRSPNDNVSPGESALAYYTKFSERGNSVYTWNSLMHNSVDSFIEGKTAMMINYSWLIPKIQAGAPKLNLGISAVPQNKDNEGHGTDIDFANYWGWAVSNNRTYSQEEIQTMGLTPGTLATNDQRIAEAWKLIRYLTMSPAYNQDPDFKAADSQETANYDPAAEYAKDQKKPAARRDLIQSQMSDILLAPFAAGNLIAQSWPQPDNLAVEKIFDEMIDDVALRNEPALDSIKQAQNRVNLLIKR